MKPEVRKAKRIIVNADDLGLCASVNTAIFEVFKAGNLSSATLMANMPGTGDALERMKDHAGLGIGLHFCISEGLALTGVSSITDGTGRFLPRGLLLKAAMRGRLNAQDLRTEFQAQWDLLQRAGAPLGHVDSHQHVLMFPPIFNALVPVLNEMAVPVRMVSPPWGTVTKDPTRPKRAAKQLLNVFFAAQDRRRFKGLTNGSLVSIHDLASHGPYSAGTYHELIARDRSDEVLEVMVHPYILGAELQEMYAHEMDSKRPFLERCVAEHAALNGNPIFASYQMLTFRDIGAT